MTTGNYSSSEWKLLVNAPQLVHHLLTAADRASAFSQRSEAKALQNYMSKYESPSDLVQAIIAGQEDADAQIEASPEEATKMLEQVGALLELKSDEAEGDAVRKFLVGAGQAIAESGREKLIGKPVSAKEQETLTTIAGALRATEPDQLRRREAAAAAEAKKRAEAEEARKKTEEEARAREAQKAEEARQQAEAEAKKKAAEEARAKAEAETKKQIEEMEARREAEAMKREAEAMKREAEELKREAEELKREAEAETKPASGPAHKPAETKPASGPAAPAAEAAGETIYVVKSGDTLSGIAKKVYGKAGRWPEIYEANRDRIENPKLIRPGWKLRIPPK
jgi:nucleoid-associated protein YgaU